MNPRKELFSGQNGDLRPFIIAEMRELTAYHNVGDGSAFVAKIDAVTTTKFSSYHLGIEAFYCISPIDSILLTSGNFDNSLIINCHPGVCSLDRFDEGSYCSS